ncbi:hypothetical protein GFS31_29000 [Leptolyngbya sp. BL0902]|uniref:hypothetical protein n=1 Tax=Leptolyngbya sp. BL0902 TaxID=1115757 RepID=UPI0018E86EAF|nr:hypothetical protein [Leptolyngbya sp. BL0902]QQE66202.1 hypothetical protein GFS31_29000 [Leptolyngbya sp. BL0902]
MQNRPPYPLQPLATLTQTETERVEEVLRLLENLFQREKATAQSVLDCLYDVGAVRLIDQKVPISALRWPLKGVARLSKPIFRIFALRWMMQNCPWLITRWMFNLLRFDGPPLIETEEVAPVIDVAPTPAALPPRLEAPLLERQAAEINALRGRVSWLTATVVVLLILGGMNWMS